MEKSINEKILKIRGSVSLPPDKEFELGEDVEVVVCGSVIQIETKDNFDGTFDKIFILKMETIKD